MIQAATTRPTRAEAAMMLVIMAMLITNIAATIWAATYEPTCMSAIVTTEKAE